MQLSALEKASLGETAPATFTKRMYGVSFYVKGQMPPAHTHTNKPWSVLGDDLQFRSGEEWTASGNLPDPLEFSKAEGKICCQLNEPVASSWFHQTERPRGHQSSTCILSRGRPFVMPQEEEKTPISWGHIFQFFWKKDDSDCNQVAASAPVRLFRYHWVHRP